ncbi:MAG: type VI secretion system baseplate subunit TssF [Polyangiales bacterium]
MDPRLLDYYERELRFMREMGAEFAQEYPKIAGRLGLEQLECSDPYVERLLEGFGLLAARVQLKIDSEFPRFTQHLLELLCPHYLAPTPSMAVVQFVPDLLEGGLAAGCDIPINSILRSRLAKSEQTPCEYRTRHPVCLWPVELKRAEYTTLLTELRDIKLDSKQRPKAMLKIQLRVTAGLRFDQLALDKLPLFLAGGDEIAQRLYEQLISSSLAIVARTPKTEREPASVQVVEQSGCVRALGFDDENALLPYGPRSFQGYRLLHEYFAFPSRYLFVELNGLTPIVRRSRAQELELLILLDREDASLEGIIDAGRLLPYCAPAVNLFPRELDRIHLSDREHEYHVVADRTRPRDLEIYSVQKVVGYGARSVGEREFLPLYAPHERGEGPPAYYTVQRLPRQVSAQARQRGPRSTYVGSEVYLSLVDGNEGPYRPDLRQLSVSALCTNRDLPLHMTVGQGRSDFALQTGAPVEAVRCVAGPSAPRASHAHGDTAWRLISHLSLNYLSLVNTDAAKGAVALRELLNLYCDLGDPSIRKQVLGVQSVKPEPVVRPLPGNGQLSFGRGLEITLECDESAFQGSGVFVLASVLERFFAKYVTINSFTETVLKTLQRGEIMRWPTTTGQRHQA